VNYDNNGNYNNGYNNYNNYPNNNYNQMPQQPTMEPIPQQMPQAQAPLVETQPMYQGGNLYDFSNELPQNNQQQMINIEPPRKKKRFSFFAFLEFLIIIFLCLYIANDKGYIHIKQLDNLIPAKEQKKEEPKEETPKKEEKVEAKVTDESIIQLLSTKTNYLSNIGVNGSNLISTIYAKTTKIEDISNNDRLSSILIGFMTLEKNAYTAMTDKEELKEVFPSLTEDKMSGILYIDANKVKEKYKEIYSEEITNTSIMDICPSITYNEKRARYYLNPYCNAAEIRSSIDQYIYKVTTLDDNYYVYLSIATYKDNGDETITVYKDYELKEKYKDYSRADFNNFKITDVYKDLNKYKLTFTKTGDNYVFKQIESVQEESIEG